MNGLAAYRPVRRYDAGGSISGDIGTLGGLNAPIGNIGPLSVTPMDVVSLAVPAVAPVNMALNAFQALSAMNAQQQEPAPVEEASVNTVADVSVSPVAAPTAPAETAIASPQGLVGLAAMTASEQAAQDQAQQEAAPDSIESALASIAESPEAVAAAAQAASTASANAQAAATAASDSGPATATGAGEASDASVSGANSEASHSADGNNSGDSGDGGGCFLTTAAVNYMGEEDNGDVLNTLRDFRDTYMRRDKEKSKDVDWYYTNAPRIMRALDGRRDAPSVYREMYVDYIEPAYEAIKAGKDKEAYGIYRNLVNFAKRKSGIENEALTPKPKHMAQGGLASYGASMNSANFPMEMRYQGGGMTPVAQAVANQGRMGDSMMVHMNPMEVAGLQALARSRGTSMTVNPQTGMPEAFNLGAFLPTLLGLGLSAATGGAATPLIAGLSNPVAIGLGTGALTAAATGSLKKGLMAGLGAYGGAGLGEGLVTSATPTTAPGMEGTLGSGVTAPPTLPGAETAGAYQSPFGAGSLTGSAPNYGLTGSTQAAGDALGGGLNIPGAPSGSMNLTGTLPADQGVQVGAAQGAQSMPGPTPGPFANMSGKDMLKYGMSAYSGTSALAQPEFKPPESNAMLRPYTYKFNPVSGAYDRVEGDSSERLYGKSEFTPGPVTRAAGGGLMASMRSTDFDEPDDMYAAGGLAAFKQGGKMQRPKGRPLVGQGLYDFMGTQDSMPTLSSVEKNFAKGGRFLVGDGDGMSDDIPAMIAGQEPARLADGEFVIPADVVSHLGNGSSKAGAKRLHDMMNRIRKERTGREKQAPAVKAEKYMPA